jgi:hypothetical protein
MKNFQNIKDDFAILGKAVSIACILTTFGFIPLNAFAQEPELYCINYWTNPNTGESECFDGNMNLITAPKPKLSESNEDNGGDNYKFEHFRSGSCVNKATNETEVEMAKTVAKMHQNIDDSMDKIDRLDEILAIERLTTAEKKEYIAIESEINVLIEENNKMFDSLEEAMVKTKSSSGSPNFRKCFNKNYDKLYENTNAVIAIFKTKPTGIRLYVPLDRRTTPSGERKR